MGEPEPQGSHAVAEELRRRLVSDIGSGVLSPGARLGSERELSEHYGVSRATLRHVLAALQEAGLVRRVPGRGGGTFISHAKLERDLSRVVGMPAYLARQGYVAGSRILSTQVIAPDDQTRTALHLSDRELVIQIRRIRLADGTPISLDHAQFPADRFTGLLEQALGGSIYELLEREYGVVPGEAEELIEVVSATENEASMLGVAPDSALLSITRTTVDSEGLAFEFSRDLFRADRTRISVKAPGRGVRSHARQDGEFVELRAIQTAL
ncbi:GntR family transcriptional regulator [Leekyejoonella antrihumi]|uniref:GntR family transcriptional regulator n=2 Tax=Leekyejoonella antrihumi TaxID=1660198 RepID=A0A563DSM1_9MICO|nr:GntR family transcriptional regulator [Leekyejoonella antrihumi]